MRPCVAPARVADVLIKRGVNTPVDVVPTGIELEEFAKGDGLRFRKAMGIPLKAFVIGFVSRIAPEKNVRYLGEVVCRFLRSNDNTCFLMIGKGPQRLYQGYFPQIQSFSSIFILHPGFSTPDRCYTMDVFVLLPEQRLRDWWLPKRWLQVYR